MELNVFKMLLQLHVVYIMYLRLYRSLLLPVLGHNALTAIPSGLNSSAIPRVHIDMPYLAIVYAEMYNIYIGWVFFSINCTENGECVMTAWNQSLCKSAQRRLYT